MGANMQNWEPVAGGADSNYVSITCSAHTVPSWRIAWRRRSAFAAEMDGLFFGAAHYVYARCLRMRARTTPCWRCALLALAGPRATKTNRSPLYKLPCNIISRTPWHCVWEHKPHEILSHWPPSWTGHKAEAAYWKRSLRKHQRKWKMSVIRHNTDQGTLHYQEERIIDFFLYSGNIDQK